MMDLAVMLTICASPVGVRCVNLAGSDFWEVADWALGREGGLVFARVDGEGAGLCME